MMWILSVTMLALGVAGASLVAPNASLGEVLYRLSPGLLSTAQDEVQRYLALWVWDDVVLSVLMRPAWVVPVILAILFAALAVRPHLARLGDLLRH